MWGELYDWACWVWGSQALEVFSIIGSLVSCITLLFHMAWTSLKIPLQKFETCCFLCIVVNMLIPRDIWVDCCAKVFCFTNCLHFSPMDPVLKYECILFICNPQHLTLVGFVGACKTGLSPPVFLYWPFQGGTSVVVPYCSCCLCLYFGSSIMLVTYFVSFG